DLLTSSCQYQKNTACQDHAWKSCPSDRAGHCKKSPNLATWELCRVDVYVCFSGQERRDQRCFGPLNRPTGVKHSTRNEGRIVGSRVQQIKSHRVAPGGHSQRETGKCRGRRSSRLRASVPASDIHTDGS